MIKVFNFQKVTQLQIWCLSSHMVWVSGTNLDEFQEGMESDSSLIYELKRLISIADRTNNSNSMKI